MFACCFLVVACRVSAAVSFFSLVKFESLSDSTFPFHPPSRCNKPVSTVSRSSLAVSFQQIEFQLAAAELVEEGEGWIPERAHGINHPGLKNGCQSEGLSHDATMNGSGMADLASH